MTRLAGFDLAMLLAPWFLPVDASAHGPVLDHHLLLNLWIALALLALAHGILLAGLVLRRRAEATRRSWSLAILWMNSTNACFSRA